MSKLQEKFSRILQEKRHVKGVNFETVRRWASGKTSPSIHTFEKVCNDNEIELPFFFDGKIESLVEYNKQLGEKMGFKVQLIFES